MAVAKLNKVQILVHRSQRQALLGALQEEGSVEVIDLSSGAGEGIFSIVLQKERAETKGLSGPLEELAWLISFLGEYDGTKRYTVTRDEYDRIAGHFRHHDLYRQCREAEADLRGLDDKRRNFIAEKQILEPWVALNIDLQDLGRTSSTVRGLAIVGEERFAALGRGARDEGLDLSLSAAGTAKKNVFCLYVYCRADEERVAALFKRHGAAYVYFPGRSGTPARILDGIDSELRGLERARSAALDRLCALEAEKKKVFVLCDHLENAQARELAGDRLLRTEEVSIVEGWVRRRDVPALRQSLEPRFPELDMTAEEPRDQDNVPVILENCSVVRPFEFITRIYGMPAYREVDPTPFLAPFFFLFFGFCITDAAYGLILAAFSLWVLARFRMGELGTRFFRLLLYGGISTVVLGALTGGWFGDLIDVAAERSGGALAVAKEFKDSLVLLDPMKDPLKLLIVALSLGVIQIWFGNIVAVYGNLKNGRYLDALLDQGSTLLFLFGFSGLILLFLGVVPSAHGRLFSHIALAGALAIVATQGRSNPTWGSRIFFGIYALYSTFSGYLSDVLSYSRLWALGLVTGVMASTVNLIAVIMGGMIPFVGGAVAAVILVGGHAVTLVMNLLGAFVHPTRLQFVEFFSKFFKGGGREFSPLRIEHRRTRVI